MRGRHGERKQIVSSLRRVSLFADCSDRELLAIDGLLSEIRIMPGRTLGGRGAASLQFMIVVDGYARVSENGTDIGRLGPGSFVGERTFQGETWNASINAITPMMVYVLNAGEFASLLRAAPSVKSRIEDQSIAQPVATPAVRLGLAQV